MLLDCLALFEVLKSFILFEVIFVFKLISLLSKLVLLGKRVCFNLKAKFVAVNLLNSWVVIYEHNHECCSQIH